MKKIALGFALAIVSIAQSAAAQVYYTAPATYSYGTYGSCVSISRDLSVGSRGSDVLSLQKFIVSRNYPGGGSWIMTGYYGSATRAGVMNLQIDAHLPQTGIVDAQTRAAIQSMTCGTSYFSQPATPIQPWYNYNNYTYGYNYNGNCSYVYGSNCVCPQGQSGWYTVNGQTYYTNCQGGNVNNGTPSISYLSPQSGTIGTTVTVYGYGFSSTNNTVRFGLPGQNPSIITGLNSYDGRSVTFTVPSTMAGYGYGYNTVVSGIYNVTVMNSSGVMSNAVTFTVNGYANNGSAPSITNISGPNTIAVNTTGTWMISINNQYNANYTSVSVNWGDPVYGAYLSAPQQIYGNGTQTATFTHAYAQTGTYTVTFTVSNAYGTNTSTATVNVTNSGTYYSAPSISYVTPTIGNVGSQIQIVGTGFNGDNTVHFGNGGKMHVTSQSGNYIYFTVPQYLSACDVQPSGSYCAQYLQLVTPGQYQLYVTTNGVNSNSLTYTVQ